MGLSTDILEASALAYINAVNAVVRHLRVQAARNGKTFKLPAIGTLL